MPEAVRIVGHKKGATDNEYLQAQVSPDGSLNIVECGYKPSDQDVSGDPMYFGFVDKDGRWYIMEQNAASGTFRYVAGLSSYTLGWTNRASQSYDYYYNIF